MRIDADKENADFALIEDADSWMICADSDPGDAGFRNPDWRGSVLRERERTGFRHGFSE